MKAKLTLDDGREIDVEVSEEQVEELAVKETYWEPKHGDTFFFPNDTPIETTFWADAFDVGMVEQGTAFKTEEECQLWIDVQKSLTRIRKYCAENFGTFVPDWSNVTQRKYFIYYDTENYRKFRTTFVQVDMRALSTPYLKSEDNAIQLIRDMESDLKVVFGIA